MAKRQQFILILTLGALSTISPFSIDMYLPGFPAIADDLDTTIAQVQLSLTSYFVGIAAGQLLYGPLLDRYGRKPPLYAGLSVYVITSLGCAFTESIDALVTMRFFQALGGCAGMVAAQALVRDLFHVSRTAQAFSWITLVIAVSPMIAPTVGGYVTVAFGWHAVFVLLGIIAVVILAGVYLILPDGKGADPDISLRPKAVLKNFLKVSSQSQFLVYGLAGGIASAGPFAYIAGSAYVFINIYGTSEQEYGWIFAIIGGSIIGGTQLNHLLLRRFSSQQVVKYTLTLQALLGVVLLTGTVFQWYDKTAFVLATVFFLAGHGLVNANATALSLAPFSRYAGSAASLLGSFRMAMGGIVSGLVSALHNETAIPMIAVMVGCTVIGGLVLLSGRSTVKYRARRKDIEEKPDLLL